jgi:ribonucleoside-triphosphate reductase
MQYFKLSEVFLKDYVGRQPEWGYDALSYFTYKRTYARNIKDEDRTEEFWETLKRVTEGVFTIQKQHCTHYRLHWDNRRAQRTAQNMFKKMWSFKFLPPGRGLWAMGTKMIEEKGSAALNNCGFVSTSKISAEGLATPFCWAMDMLMLGCGIGFDTKGAGFVVKAAQQSDATYVIPDTREGWVQSVEIIFEAFNNGRPLPGFDYTKIREAGAIIEGFGGVASGPGPLKYLHESIIALLTLRIDEELSSVDITDLFNFIGRCVVAGNVRRSAEIGIGLVKDYEFITCKDPSIEKNQAAMLSHRWASNNALYVNDGDDLSFPASITAKNGEPGYIFEDIIKTYGRLCDAPDYVDSDYAGMNPCVEQVLESYELCNVVEDFPANHDNKEEFWDTLKYAYMYAKTVALLPTHDPRTNAVMLRNRRIGLSQSGIEQAKAKFGTSNYYRDFCDKAYAVVSKWDKAYSRWFCVPESKRKSSVKPSGTVSLMAGAFPGVHCAHSEYYLRTVRLAKNSPLLTSLRRANYRIEDSVSDPYTAVVYFPINEKNFRKSKSDITMWEQLNNAAMMQRYWADNSVSVTISFHEHEAADIPEALEMYRDKLKAVSFLPFTEHGYEQPPYGTINKEEYDKYASTLGVLSFVKAISNEDRAADKFCQGEACEIDISQKMKV